MRDYTISEIEAICKSLVRHGGTPIRPMGVPFLDDRIQGYEDKYKGGHSYYSVLRAISQALKPSVILEVGTWEGTSAACFADGAPEALVVTIDHHSDPGDDVNKAKTILAHEQYRNIYYVQGCSTEIVLKEKPGSRFVLPIVEEKLAGRKIDIMLVDGWHSGVMARADYDTYKHLFSENALVICDDLIGGDHVTIFGMREFYDNIPGKERYLDGAIHPGFPMGFIKHGSV